MSADMQSEAREDTRFEIAGGQAASLIVEWDDDGREPQVFQTRLLNLSRAGAKLSVPVALPLHRTMRLKLRVEQFALDFYVSAEVCWSRSDGNGVYHVGCSLNPGIPPSLLAQLAMDGRLDRRDTARYESSLAVQALWDLDGSGEEVTLRNFSRGGFCVSARQPAKPGERIHLEVKGPEEFLIVAKAQWQMRLEDQYLLGCVLLNPNDFERLQEVCLAQEAVGGVA